ncbi:hypothetical protein ACIBI0_38490 [Microbispora rosea]|uniref:putative phage holin n=1 Tax=Microbispora rosea TaxID=58117 RepID=UPI0037AF2E4A
MTDNLTTLATVLVVADFVTSLAFCVAYHLVARWWHHPFGTSLMIYQGLMTVVMGFTAWRFLTRADFPLVANIARTVVFAALPIALIWRTVVMIRVQRREGRQEFAPGPGEAE